MRGECVFCELLFYVKNLGSVRIVFVFFYNGIFVDCWWYIVYYVEWDVGFWFWVVRYLYLWWVVGF